MILTLKGPKSVARIKTNKTDLLFEYYDWLCKYNPAPTVKNFYPIASENKLKACRVKARKLGLMAE